MVLIEFLIALVLGVVLIVGPIATFILSLIAYIRSRRIEQLTLRIVELERRVRAASKSTPNEVAPIPSAVSIAPAVAADFSGRATPYVPSSHSPESQAEYNKSANAITSSQTVVTTAAGWENFVGQKAFGWLAVFLFVLAFAFFLRYAYQNNWIGPVGRVTISELVGLGLVCAGWWYFRHGLIRFSNMMTAAGIVVLYLATYSAFGFYHLLPQQRAGIFLGVLVFESMILAVFYRSSIIAMVAVIGGLLTPMLMASDVDDYSSLFIYLAVLNAGVAIAVGMRGWSFVSWISFLGTQALFALWYQSNYHPDKFIWTIGFQVILFCLYLGQSLFTSAVRRRMLSPIELTLFVVNAILGFYLFRLLLQDQYSYWLGSFALFMATLYAVVARVILSTNNRDSRFCLTSIAISVGLIAIALPLQTNAGWVALGWAAMGSVIGWFGLRISNPLLRVFALVLAVSAIARLLMFDLPLYIRDPFIPIFNREALPSLGVSLCVLASVVIADRYLKYLSAIEKHIIAVMGVAGVLLFWLVLSFECYGYFLSQSVGDNSLDIDVWRWRGQLALTLFWASFATIILVLGFRFDRARLRWLAIAIYGAAVLKLFIVDMASVQQLYRICVFFVLAIVLGLVARAYQRFK